MLKNNINKKMELIYNISTNSCPILLFGETFYEQNKNKLKIFIN